MKSRTNKFSLVFTLFGTIATAILSLSYSSGSPGDRSGSPLGSGTCASCHGGGMGGGSVALTGAPTSYVRGQTYPLTLTVADGDMGSAGFMIAAVDITNSSYIGSFNYAMGSGIRDESSGITHESKKTASSGQVSWSFNWVAPNTGSGNIRFFYVGNAVNNDFGTSGDDVYVNTSAIIPLPVELITWQARQNTDGTIALAWETAQELNNKGFEIERSADGKNFKTMAFVKGQGDSKAQKSYNFSDNTPLSKTAYYRLQQVDFDGKKTASKVVSVENSAAKNSFTVYPNPSSDNRIMVDFGNNFDENARKETKIRIFNTLGQLVLEQKSNTAQFQLDISSLAKGSYYIQKMGNTEGVKFVKN